MHFHESVYIVVAKSIISGQRVPTLIFRKVAAYFSFLSSLLLFTRVASFGICVYDNYLLYLSYNMRDFIAIGELVILHNLIIIELSTNEESYF